MIRAAFAWSAQRLKIIIIIITIKIIVIIIMTTIINKINHESNKIQNDSS
jgi:hypothetical protein